MARRRPVHDRLVGEALARQRAAGNKLSRLRRRGIVTDSIDPRSSAADVRAMSNDQLRRYTERLDTFVRNRGYVAGAGGAPINRTAYEYLKRLERQNNRIVAGYEQQVGNIKVPTLGDQDIASQIERAQRNRLTAGGEQATFQRYSRQAADITGQSSIMKLIDNMRKKLEPGYLSDRMGILRQNLEKMLETIGDESLIQRVMNISDETLNVINDYSPFMKALSTRYEFMKAFRADEEYQPEAWMQDVYDTALDNIYEFIDWADTLDKKNGNVAGKTQYTNTNAGPIPVQKPNEYTDTNARPIPVQRPRRTDGKPGKRK